MYKFSVNNVCLTVTAGSVFKCVCADFIQF